MAMETVRSADGTTIAYERTGDGPVLLLLGGALGNRHSASLLAPLLAEHFSIIAIDRRGRGDSGDTPPYAPAREVEDVQAIIGAAGGSAYVYGHSSGAALAMETAATGEMITRLAVYEPPYLTTEDHVRAPAEHLRQIRAALDSGNPDKAVEIFMRGTGAPWDEGIKQTPWWPGMVAMAHTLPYDLAILGDRSVPTERLARIKAPTLGIYGGASPGWARASITAVTEAIPGARQTVLDGQTHGAAPEVLAPVLIHFFQLA